MKVEALVQIRIQPLAEKGEKPLRVSQAPAWQAKSRKIDVLYEGQYRTVKKAECPQTKPAVVVDGSDAGTLLHVCLDQKCSVHARVSNYQPTPQERAARAKELLAERIEKESRVRILNAVRKKIPRRSRVPISKWLYSIISSGSVTTITAASAVFMDGRRERPKRRIAELAWATKSSHRKQCAE
jgi:hypothetical protein